MLSDALPAASVHAQAERGVIEVVRWLKLGVEAVGAIIIALGIVAAGWQFVRAQFVHQTTGFTAIRLTLARYLALALEF